MQTFLPYADFAESAAVLDRSRLGKQRVENLQIMGTLQDPSRGWRNHPAVRMWRGCEIALMRYQDAICYEWTKIRGYRDTCFVKTLALMDLDEFQWQRGFVDGPYPNWLGDEDLHVSHRSNLLRKNEEWYRQFGWTEPTTLEYVWPT